MGDDNYRGSGLRKPKRTKIAAACESCRQRKTRCDGLRPACGPCQRRGLAETECTYMEKGRDIAQSQSYIQQLERKIFELEQRRGHPRPNPTTITAATSAAAAVATATATATATTPILSIHPILGTVTVSLTNDDLDDPTAVEASSSEHDLSNQPSVVRSDDLFRPSGGLSSDSFASDHALPGRDQLPSASVKNMYRNIPGAAEETEFLQWSKSVQRAPSMGFLRQVRDLSETDSQLPYSDSVKLNSTGLPQPAGKVQKDDPGYILPVRAVADDLMRLYWAEIHPIFPFVHRPSFKRQYNSLWTGEGIPPTRLFHCNLNVIFALSCQMNLALSAEARASSAASYYERGQRLLCFDVTELGTFETVQSLLLVAQYFQSINNQSRCWAILGTAVRTAQSLGLRREFSMSFMTQCEKEMFRRVWHGCILLERIVAHTLSFPATISEFPAQSIPLPSAVDDEYLSTDVDVENRQPSDQPSELEFFIQTMKLHGILTEVTSQFYATTDPSDTTKTTRSSSSLKEPHYRFVVDIEEKLNFFWSSLPRFLDSAKRDPDRSDKEARGVFLHQSRVLQNRFLFTRILLFRPFLAQLTSKQNYHPTSKLLSDELSVKQSILVRSAIICIKSAQELISQLNEDFGRNASVLPAYWYNVIFVYTAATTILAARVYPIPLVNFGQTDLDRTWQQAIHILDRYERLNISRDPAQKCLAALTLLNDKTAAFRGHLARQESQQPAATQPMSTADTVASAGLQYSAEMVTFEDPTLLGGPIDMDWDWLNTSLFGLDVQTAFP
ncbi:Fungal Zn2-Cys6 binuclear cluster domain-containing protein isoform 2 [Cladophialophora immunda]|nr:Fungal Zn2-Cys6 binuclear cluster domain-containing protein isoform 2 [Cladophialophora immunda]